MKITGVRTKPYEIKLNRRIGDVNSPGGRDTMGQLVVYLDTDEGITGISAAMPGLEKLIERMVDGVLKGKDPRGVRGLWQRMVDVVFKEGNRGAANSTIVALDIALWDLKAKANNEPLWKTLGASTRKVKLYASGLDLPLPDEEMKAFYLRMAKQGISAGKLKIGLDMEEDLRRLDIMKEALETSGKKAELMVDSNEYWSPKQAIRYLRQIEEHYDLTWAEEPARRWDWQGLKKVSDGITAAVASGENLDEIFEYTPLIANRAVDIVQLNVGGAGITNCLQVADMAYGFDLPVSLINNMGNCMGHVAAALPNHINMETLSAGRDAVVKVDNRIEDGWLILGDSPGLGLTVDEEMLAASAPKADPVSGEAIRGRRRGAGLYIVGRDEPVDIDE